MSTQAEQDRRKHMLMLQPLFDRLAIEDTWILAEPHGAGFVVGELGTWLTLGTSTQRTPLLHVEVRVGVDTPDDDRPSLFCNNRNNLALIGRWIHDPTTRTVALVASLPLGGRLTLAVETPDPGDAAGSSSVRRLDAGVVLLAQGYGVDAIALPPGLHELAGGFGGGLEVERIDALTQRVTLRIPRAFVIAHAA